MAAILTDIVFVIVCVVLCPLNDVLQVQVSLQSVLLFLELVDKCLFFGGQNHVSNEVWSLNAKIVDFDKLTEDSGMVA